MKPNKNELKKIRKTLKDHGFGICYSKWCNGKIKDIKEFYKDRNICKKCKNFKDKEFHIKNMRAHTRIKFKLKYGKKCELCDCDDINMLEFDHIEQKDKSFGISTIQNTKKIIEESQKTRLLCIWCHRLHSKKQIEDNILKSKENYNYTYVENNEVIDMDNSKKCEGVFCNGRLRNRKWFYVSKGKYKSICKKCSNYYSLLKRIENRDYIDSVKIYIGSCQECNIKVTLDTLCCFDFDHIERNKKVINISRLALANYNVRKKIDLEIKKCQLLCCYCHKKKTIDDLNYTKFDSKTINRLNNKPKPVKNTVCPNCNGEKTGYSKLCNPCMGLKYRKVKRPSYEILMKEINETSYLAVGRKYGVTDNAIRKWVKNYEKNMENINE